jgi:uncharacterized protein (UPF0303 family)
MSVAEDIARIAEQEATLVFQSFDEAIAFAIGSAIRERALKEKLGIVVDIRTWDRPLFYTALPGSTGSNPSWARRKINVVKMFLKSTYRMVLEQGREDRTPPPGWGLSAADYVLAGGGFPIRVKNAGVIGVIAVSGLPERQDHGIVVDAICDHLGLDRQELALPVPAVK